MHQHLTLLAFVFALPAISLTNHVLNTECFSSPGSLKDQGRYRFQSPGYCQAQCRKNGFTVAGLSEGTNCWCGNEKPPQRTRDDAQKCNVMCTGWPEEKCGGKHAWTVFSTGDPELAPSNDNSTVSASTAPGGIIVAPTTTTSVTTAILTAPSKAATASVSSASASASESASVSASKSKASASTTPSNAASAARAGSSLFGVVIAGLGLLL